MQYLLKSEKLSVFFYCSEDEEIKEKLILVCNRCTVGHKNGVSAEIFVILWVKTGERHCHRFVTHQYRRKESIRLWRLKTRH